jgi:hypothetical protein
MAPDDTNTNQSTGVTDTMKTGRQSRNAKRGSFGASGRRGSETGQSRSGRSSGSTMSGEDTGVSALSRRAKRMMNDAGEWAEETTGALPRLAKNLHLPSPSLPSITDANPLVLGAVGLGLGVIIGALLPRNMIDSSMHGLGMSSGGRSSRSQDSSSDETSRSSGRSTSRSSRSGSGRGRSRKAVKS